MKKITLTLSLLLTFSMSFSQDDQDYTNGNQYVISRYDGGEYIGEIISDDGREILIITQSIGKIYIRKSMISSIKKIENGEITYDEDYKATGPFTTRYYFTNNALPIKKNENYAMINLLGPEIQLSVTNSTSIGIMASWIASPIGVVLKQQLLTKNTFHLSLGTIMGTSGYIEQGSIFGGLHWLTATFGDRSTNISFSGGVGYMKWPNAQNSSIMNNQRRIGENYGYNFNDESHPYYVPDNPYDTTTTSYNSTWGWGGYYGYDRREQALRDELYTTNYYSNFNTEIFQYKDFQLASLFSISAITPIGKKASFIFDSMIISRNKKQLRYTGEREVDIDYTVYNTLTGLDDQYDQTILVGTDPVISDDTYNHTTLIFMPAVRFSKSFEKAFQISLAGFIDIHELNGTVSAPVPTISWLRKF